MAERGRNVQADELSMADRVTAAVMIIGDEILSGRTQDTNLNFIAKYLGTYGVDLAEARVVPDVKDEIISALNALRAKYDYVITTGGIGPTHDDITADCVADAFGVKLVEHPDILEMMEKRWGGELNAARRRMARVPEGGSLVKNGVQGPPGFAIGNVFVLAGVPLVMQAMLDSAVKEMRTGAVMQIESIEAGAVPEGRYGDALGRIAEARPTVTIGSYPSFKDGRFANQIVVRGKDAAEVSEARAAVEAMLAEIRGDGKPF